MDKLAGYIGFVYPQLLPDHLDQFFLGHILKFFRFHDPAHIAAHGALAGHIAPAGLDAIAALNAENDDGQRQFLGK